VHTDKAEPFAGAKQKNHNPRETNKRQITYNDGPKPLHVRVWQCQGCGAWLDRDINAAVNVAKAAGLAVTACGAQVRPGLALAQRCEAGTRPKSHQQPA